jgi:hypothetical protein
VDEARDEAEKGGGNVVSGSVIKRESVGWKEAEKRETFVECTKDGTERAE